jgi:hypothetical protein
MRRREALPTPAREIMRGTAAETVTRGVGVILEGITPHFGSLGTPMSATETITELGGAAVLRDLDGRPDLVVMLRVCLPTPDAMEEAAAMSLGRGVRR